MTVLPGSRVTERGDFESRVASVDRSRNLKLQTFNETESVVTFGLMFTSDFDTTAFSYAVDELSPNSAQDMKNANTGAEMPYQPDAGTELQVYKWWVGVDVDLRVNMFVDGDLFSKWYAEGGNWGFEQEPALFKLSQVNPSLDGSTQFRWEVENMSDNAPINGSIFNYAIENTDP